MNQKEKIALRRAVEAMAGREAAYSDMRCVPNHPRNIKWRRLNFYGGFMHDENGRSVEGFAKHLFRGNLKDMRKAGLLVRGEYVWVPPEMERGLVRRGLALRKLEARAKAGECSPKDYGRDLDVPSDKIMALAKKCGVRGGAKNIEKFLTKWLKMIGEYC